MQGQIGAQACPIVLVLLNVLLLLDNPFDSQGEAKLIPTTSTGPRYAAR